jgi:meiotically up-regulated gene 157 (Mug157) protein
MALVVEGLTEEGESTDERMAFQMRQLLLSAKDDAMHESVNVQNEQGVTRPWFEWVSIPHLIF